MKKIKLFGLITVLVLSACGSQHVDPQPEKKTYNLLKDDGIGVIFNSTETTNATPAQIKIYDNDLRAILNGETFPGNTGSVNYALHYAPSKIVVFGVTYKEVTISEIICEKSNNQALQLHFDDKQYNPGSSIFDDGIYWTELVDMNGAPIVEDRTIPCVGGGKSFNLNVFKDNEISDPEFTLYLDFVNFKFRGRIVLTEAGLEPETDGIALNFK